DGLPHRAILQKLQPSNTPSPHDSTTTVLPYTLSEMNLSNWKNGGSDDWRRQNRINEFLKSSASATPGLSASIRTTPRPTAPIKGQHRTAAGPTASLARISPRPSETIRANPSQSEPAKG